MSCSEHVKDLFDQSRRTITRVEVSPDLARVAIAAYMSEMVPSLGDGSFCPEGREFRAASMYDPVVSLVLGEPEFNGDRVYIDAGWYAVAIHYDKPEGVAYDEATDTWVLWIDTTWWTDGVGSPRRMLNQAIGVPIPGPVMEGLFALILGEHKHVEVVWRW